jgi:hypothetical protein
MIMRIFLFSILSFFLVPSLFWNCSGFDRTKAVSSSENIRIFPDYTDLTIPPNIAPMNFLVDMEGGRFVVDFIGENGYTFSISTKEDVIIPEKKWQHLLSENIGKFYHIQIYRKLNGNWEKLPIITNQISTDSIDPWFTYRFLPSANDIFKDINIQQRHLESFEVFDMVDNSISDGSCLGCHVPNSGNPNEFVMHSRILNPGTIVYKDGQFRRLNTVTPEFTLAGAYPAWHPSGRFIAFAVTKAAFVFQSDMRSRATIFDETGADIALLDLETNTFLASPKLKTNDITIQETFPSWSPDGKYLYFSRSRFLGGAEAIDEVDTILGLQFDLLRIPFDENTISFGEPEVLIDAYKLNKSVSIPKVSPDGRWLLFHLTHRGSNPVWRHDADLFLMDLQTLEWWPLTEANSNDAESWASWSSNSRWIGFTSKRNDGFVALPYFSHIDANGHASKAFVLPQKDPKFYKSFMKSFNVPEFAKGKVNLTFDEFEQAIKGPIIQVGFGWTNDTDFQKQQK